MELADGTIIPSTLSVGGPSPTSFKLTVEDVSLRVGRVIAAYSRGDKLSRNNQYVEYDVEVNYANGSGPYTKIVYPRCIVASMFGGVADYFRWTPRIDNFDPTHDIGFGSRVLVLCINGNSRFAYIIGGIPHPDSATNDLNYKDNQPYLNWEFNGVRANINKKGDFILLRRGATKSNGDVIDNTNSGAFFSFLSDGTISLAYNDGTTTSSIFLNKTSDTVQILAKNEIDINTNTTINMIADQGVKINGGTQAFVNGTTYRSSESTLNNTLSTTETSSAGVVGTAGTALTAASPLLLIPIVGPILAAPFVLTAGVSLTALAGFLTAKATAYNVFEGGSNLYLSNINAHDDGSSAVNVPPTPGAVQNAASNNPKGA